MLGLAMASHLLQAAIPTLTWIWANPLPHGNHIYDMAVGPGTVVQACEQGQIYTSIDGQLWFPRASHTSQALRTVAFFNDFVVITGEEGTALYADSTAAETGPFTLIDLETSDWLEAVAASPALVVAVGDNGAIYTSTTGTNWTRRPQSFNVWLRGVAYGSDIFVAVGEGGIITTSTDGLTWRTRNSGTTSDLNRVDWLEDHFAVVGSNGVMLSSRQGISWSEVSGSGAVNDLYTVAGTSDITLAISTKAKIGTFDDSCCR